MARARIFIGTPIGKLVVANRYSKSGANSGKPGVLMVNNSKGLCGV
jgi:hypothetical protein